MEGGSDGRTGEEEAEGTKNQEVGLCYLTEYAK